MNADGHYRRKTPRRAELKSAQAMLLKALAAQPGE
jgi:hypothetical protein